MEDNESGTLEYIPEHAYEALPDIGLSDTVLAIKENVDF